MFVTVLIVATALFAAITGLVSRRRGGNIPVRDKSVPRGDLLAGGSLPRELPPERDPARGRRR
jgi:hypothetical protein